MAAIKSFWIWSGWEWKNVLCEHIWSHAKLLLCYYCSRCKTFFWLFGYSTRKHLLFQTVGKLKTHSCCSECVVPRKIEIERKEEKVNLAISFNAYSRMNCIMYICICFECEEKKSKKGRNGKFNKFSRSRNGLEPNESRPICVQHTKH